MDTIFGGNPTHFVLFCFSSANVSSWDLSHDLLDSKDKLTKQLYSSRSVDSSES